MQDCRQGGEMDSGLTHHVFTRRQLFERIWTEPMRTVALSLGVSDVGLAKACRAADIPVPPRGYWAKLQHGKPVPKKPLLPDRPEGQDRVVIAPPRPKPPPPPEIQAAIETALARIAEIPVPEDLRGAHPIVRGWLETNAAQRKEYRRNGWGLGLIEDLTTPLAGRRLRITSALLKTLERKRLKVGSGREGLTVTRNGETLTFTLYERGRVEHRPATADELRWYPERKTVRATVPAGDLVLKIRDYLSLPTDFRELKTPLEDRLPTVVATLEAGLEELAARRRQRALDAERAEAAARDQRRRKAYREAAEAQRERLFAQAERHRRAEAVRTYIAAADASDLAAGDDYAAWRAWALAEADATDPLLDGSAPFSRLPPIEDWAWRGW